MFFKLDVEVGILAINFIQEHEKSNPKTHGKATLDLTG